MPRHKRRDRSLSLDPPENREAARSVAILPFSKIQVPANSRPAPFHANTTATVIEANEDGSFTAVVRGRASLLGRFTGFLSITSPSKDAVGVQLQMNGVQRSLLQVRMTVFGDKDDASRLNFQGTFAIAGGTERLANAVGGGTVTGFLDPRAQTLSFDLQGTIARR
jgi:hypothetical protein